MAYWFRALAAIAENQVYSPASTAARSYLVEGSFRHTLIHVNELLKKNKTKQKTRCIASLENHQRLTYALYIETYRHTHTHKSVEQKFFAFFKAYNPVLQRVTA